MTLPTVLIVEARYVTPVLLDFSTFANYNQKIASRWGFIIQDDGQDQIELKAMNLSGWSGFACIVLS